MYRLFRVMECRENVIRRAVGVGGWRKGGGDPLISTLIWDQRRRGPQMGSGDGTQICVKTFDLLFINVSNCKWRIRLKSPKKLRDSFRRLCSRIFRFGPPQGVNPFLFVNVSFAAHILIYFAVGWCFHRCLAFCTPLTTNTHKYTHIHTHIHTHLTDSDWTWPGNLHLTLMYYFLIGFRQAKWKLSSFFYDQYNTKCRKVQSICSMEHCIMTLQKRSNSSLILYLDMDLVL